MPHLFHSETTHAFDHDNGYIQGMIKNQKLVYTFYTQYKYPSIQSVSPASSLLKQQVSKPDSLIQHNISGIPCVNLSAVCVIHTFNQSCSVTAVCCLMSQQFLDNILCYIWFHMLSWAQTVLLCILNLALQYCVDCLMMAKNDQTCSYSEIKNSGCVRRTVVICSCSINTMGHTPLN